MWQNKYIGIPYKDHGRDKAGIDCWGLARLIYKEEFNIDLPSFSEDNFYNSEDSTQIAEIFAQNMEGWAKSEVPSPGNLVLFRIMGDISHIGIAISATHFIHARENYSSAIEAFDSINWKHRCEGFYKYTPQAFSNNLVAVPHPLRSEKLIMSIPYGSTIEQVYDTVKTFKNISDKLKAKITIIKNSQVIPQELWATTIVKQGDTLEYRAVPGKSAVRLVLTLVVIYVAVTYLGPMLGPEVGSALGLTAAQGTALVVSAATMAGTMLINAIMPIRPPDMPGGQDDPGSAKAQLMFGAATNRSNAYGSIPFVLGKMRITPPLGAQNFIRFGELTSGIVDSADKSYLDMLLVWGYGPLHIDETTMRIGEISVYDYSTTPATANFEKLRYITLDRKITEPASELVEFNTIYGKDIEQVYKGVELTCEGLPPIAASSNFTWWAGRRDTTPWAPTATPGPWIEAGFQNSCDKISVAIHFPQGLRAIIVQGEGAGGTRAAPVSLSFEYRTNSMLAWAPWTTQSIGGTLTSYSVVNYPESQAYDSENGYYYTVPAYSVTTLANYITEGAPRKDAFTWTITKDRITNGVEAWPSTEPVQIRVRRNSGDNGEPNSNYRYSHGAQFQSITAISNTAPAIDPKNSKIAKTALTIQATDQINNQMDGISAVVQTWCLDWNGSTWAEAATSNPASLFRYVLQSAANPQRILDADITSKIDLVQVQYWHSFCNQTRTDPETNETYKFEFNDIIAAQRSVLDILRDICAAGKASPALIDGRWTVVIDEPRTQIIQHFSPHNSWDFESTKILPRFPDALKVQYYDQDFDYQQRELIIPFAGKTVATSELFETIQLPGVTKKALAKDHARWHMAQVSLRPEIYTLNSDIEYLVCNRGDRVKVAHDVPMWGLGSGRIKSRVTSSIFDLDEDVPLDNDKTYTMRIRSSTGASTNATIKSIFNAVSIKRATNIVTVTLDQAHPLQINDIVTVSIPQVAVDSAIITSITNSTFTYKLIGSSISTTTVTGTINLQDGYYSRVQTTESYDDSLINFGDLFLFGEFQSESQDLIVLNIEPSGNKSARITLVDYGVTDTYNIFTDYLSFSASTIFESQVTLPSKLLIDSFGIKKPIITDMISDETVMEVIAPGIFAYKMQVSYINDNDLPENTSHVEAQIDYLDATDTIGIRSLNTEYTKGSIIFDDVEELAYYKVRLRYVGKDGRIGTWTTWKDHQIVGKTSKPSNVLNFNSSIAVNGGKILLTWNNNLELDIQGYEVRLEDSSWGTLTNMLYKGPNTQVEIDPKVLISDDTLYIKAYDYSNNYSNDTTTLNITKPLPTGIDSSTIVSVFGNDNFTTSTVTLSWEIPDQTGFAIAGYQVAYGTKKVFVNANTLTISVDWLQERVFEITVVDIIGTVSATASIVVTKLPPSTVKDFTAVLNKSSGSILLSWRGNAEADIQAYEVRTIESETDWGSDPGLIYRGTNTQVDVNAKDIINDTVVYIKAIDLNNNYSILPADLTIIKPSPTSIDTNSITGTFADTSLTSATVTLSWQKAANSSFDIAGYDVAYDNTVVFINANSIILPADWVGNRIFGITTIDILGQKSSTINKVIAKLPPNPIPLNSYKIQVIDNNVLLYWAMPEKTTLPISHVVLRKTKQLPGISNYTWETAELVGDKSGTFTSFSELSKGDYLYWIKVVDTDGVESSEVYKSVSVSQPTDFIFNALFPSVFEGTKVNSIKDTISSNLVLPINQSETWQEHFILQGWDTPEDQINAGYPKYIQPGEITGSYTEIFDYETVLASSQITVETTAQTLVGSVIVNYFVSHSLDNITYSSPDKSSYSLGVNFRYIKVQLEVIAVTPGSIYELTSLNIRLDSKKIVDNGKILALSTDTSGTIINFSKPFIDITNILVSASGTSARTANYSFGDYITEATFTVLGSACTLATINAHDLIIGQNIRVAFNTGNIPIGVYTITAVPTPYTLTFNIASGTATSGTASFFPNSMRVYVFDTDGVRQTEQVSWSITGF